MTMCRRGARRSTHRTAVAPVFVAAVLVALLAACAGSPAAPAGPRGVLRVALEGAPESWEPGSDVGFGYLSPVYENLVTFDREYRINPELATQWEQTPDQVTMMLRQGVSFHDGTPFDAEAVKANIEAVQAGGGPFSAGFGTVTSIDVVDTHTVRFRLSEPTASLLSSLAQRGGLMSSPAALSAGSAARIPVGTGPWAYDSVSSRDQLIAFQQFGGYWGEAPPIPRLEIRVVDDGRARLSAVQTGEVDLADLDLSLGSQVAASGLEQAAFPALHYGMFFFDRGPGGVFADREVRRAVCQAVDTAALAAVGGTGQVRAMTQRAAEGQYGYNPDIRPLELDPEVASTLQGRGIASSAAVFESNRLLGEAAAGELAKYGVELTIEPVDASQYFGEWYTGKWGLGFGDNSEVHPEEWYRTWFAADGPNNPSGVESPQLRAAAAQASAAGVSDEAERLWAEVARIIDDEALTCKHLSVQSALVWNAARLEVTDPRYGEYIGVRLK